MSERLPRNLEKRGDVYYVRIMIDGRRKRISTGRTTLKAAIREADEIKVRLRNDWDRGKVRVPMFVDWIDHYFATYSIRKRAGWADHSTLRPALQYFRHYRLDEIPPSLCEKYLVQRNQLRAPSTVNRERAVLADAFQRAVDDGLIERNPWRKTKSNAVEPRVRLLTLENEHKLRQVLSPRYQRWLTFMLGTGLRIAEAIAVTEHLVDTERQLIRVPSEAAKGGKSRDVPLLPPVERSIREELQAHERLWHGTPQQFNDMLKRKAQKAGIPHLSPHDLRHTFATRYLQGGGDIYVLSQILGHASVVITEKTYVHLVGTDLVERSRNVKLALAA